MDAGATLSLALVQELTKVNEVSRAEGEGHEADLTATFRAGCIRFSATSQPATLGLNMQRKIDGA